ncbi:hypothetical protein E0E54_09405 [Azotobacter chroococcum]|jgi:hypothetical protein|uniref:Uncharacterized protein n=1 Tax=Azotobacter chroococcum TaxID=353 RepID=A0A4Q9VNX9_9GAMM|nr:DUF6402 family protein [Azotobacter chroococcum]TBV98930.1 hypothetical protein E0E53_05115 [Azotobacter chroococcum]TBW36558.1 hypothetical protein E0E54_09405 [Azotobacter chroococcum]TCL29333.1 hypothetical protein EV691_1197 [Azotobacter chroococcum]
MRIEPVHSRLTPASQTDGKEAAIENFKISDIPAAMDHMQWTQSARLMRKWFAAPAHEMPKAVKLGDIRANTLPPAQLLTDLPFDWLLSASNRVRPIVEEHVAQLTSVTEFSPLVGRLKTPLDQLSKGLMMLMTRLRRLGLLDPQKRTLKNYYLDLGDYNAMQLEDTIQFNLFKVGSTTWEKATDTLDDVYGALGSFIIKIAATKLRAMASDYGYAAIKIEEIGLYVRDTYDFLNVGKDQLLGYWSKRGVIRPSPIDYFAEPSCIDTNDVRHFKVTNGSFNSYRKKYNKGGDFLVFSTIKRYPVSIIVHLSITDFDEYRARTGLA